MKPNKKLRGDQGYERIILISMQIFTIIFFITIIATDGDLLWIGGNAGVVVIYFFMLSNNRKDKIIVQQKKISGITNWESWTVTSSENSEFNVYGIKNMWKLTQISREQRDFVDKTVKMIAAKPIPKPIELAHSESQPIPYTESRIENCSYPPGINLDQIDQEEQNLLQPYPDLTIPNLDDVLATSSQSTPISNELNEIPEQSINEEEGLTDDQIPTVDYDPDEIEKEKQMEKISEIPVPDLQTSPTTPEKNKIKDEVIQDKPQIKNTNRKKRGKKK